MVQSIKGGGGFWNTKIQLSYFLAVLVFLIHIPTFTIYSSDGSIFSDLNTFVQRFKGTFSQVAVPLFFMISGFLFFRSYTKSQYIDKLKRRFKTLLIPYLLWNLFGMLLSIIATLFLSKYFVSKTPFEFTISNIFQSIFLYKDNTPFWFIFDLISFSVISPVIFLLIKNKYIGIISIITILLLYGFGIQIPASIFFRSDAIIYYMLGAFLGYHYFNRFSVIEIKRPFVFFILILVSNIWLFVFFETESTELFLGKCIEVIVLVIYSISLYCLFLRFTDVLPNRPFMKHSFWVYALHMKMGAITKLIWVFFPQSFMAIPNFLFTIIVTLVIIEYLSRLTCRYCPSLYELLSGGR